MFIEIINTYGPALLDLLLTIIFSAIGILLGRYLNTELKQTIARNAMLFVEQTVKDLHGEDKMLKALNVAAQLLAKWKIKFDAKEMRTLIEAALGAFNNGVNKGAGVTIVATEEDVAEFDDAAKLPVNAEDTAKATYRVPENAEAST